HRERLDAEPYSLRGRPAGVGEDEMQTDPGSIRVIRQVIMRLCRGKGYPWSLLRCEHVLRESGASSGLGDRGLHIGLLGPGRSHQVAPLSDPGLPYHEPGPPQSERGKCQDNSEGCRDGLAVIFKKGGKPNKGAQDRAMENAAIFCHIPIAVDVVAYLIASCA